MSTQEWRRHRLWFAAFVIAGTTFSQTALAGPPYGLRTDLYVQATGGSQDTQQTDTGLVQSPSLSITKAATTTDNAVTDSSTGSATASYGSLTVSGSGQAAPSCMPFVGCDGANSRVISTVGGDPLAYFEDTLSVTSSTFAAGTLVNVTFSMFFTGDASFLTEPSGPAFASYSDISAKFSLADSVGRSPSADFVTQYTGPGFFTDVETITVGVGDTLFITGALYGGGEADSNDALSPTNFSFSGSATMYGDSQSAGVSLVAASGHDYGSPAAVPEPESWTMLMAGLGLLGFMARRRKQKLAA